MPGLEDPLEKRMATYSSILAWKIPWTEEPGGLHTEKKRRRGEIPKECISIASDPDSGH